MPRAEVYLESAYASLRNAGLALAAASVLALLGFFTLAVGASTITVYVNPETGEIVPNATRADVEAGIVVEEVRVNSTMLKTLLSTSLGRAGSLLAGLGGEGRIAHSGYAEALLLMAALLALAASAYLRGAAVVFRDYASAFRAGVVGGWLKIAGSIVLLYTVWQVFSSISQGSEALLLGSLGFYYTGGVLVTAGAILFAAPLIAAGEKVQAPGLAKAGAALLVLGAAVAFTAVNTVQLIAGPLVCLASGLTLALAAGKALKAIGGA
ncbi:hypothetical protein [Stetteria hydrogenophila]